MDGDFRVAAGEAQVAEFDEGACLVWVGHRCTTLRRHEHIGEEFKAHLVIVLHDPRIRVLHILSGKVANHADLNQLPVATHNVASLFILEDQQAE